MTIRGSFIPAETKWRVILLRFSHFSPRSISSKLRPVLENREYRSVFDRQSPSQHAFAAVAGLLERTRQLLR
ncbi:hypothetical protein D8S78_16720 [Natrialba swarupiae]|nr:hypothetical protein [Natrialba swarupiae]